MLLLLIAYALPAAVQASGEPLLFCLGDSNTWDTSYGPPGNGGVCADWAEGVSHWHSLCAPSFDMMNHGDGLHVYEVCPECGYCVPHPTVSPTVAPTNPTYHPTVKPTVNPSDNPTVAPSFNPSVGPTKSPSNSPSFGPSHGPSHSPSQHPTVGPSVSPSRDPTLHPSHQPSVSPVTSEPTASPSSSNPSYSPLSSSPSKSPSNAPSFKPTSSSPSKTPLSSAPTRSPSGLPSGSPSVSSPTQDPTVSAPTEGPTAYVHTVTLELDGDYDEVVGENKADFLAKCTTHLGVTCTDVMSGSILVVLAGSEEDVNAAVSTVEASGLALPGYPALTVQTTDAPVTATESSNSDKTAVIVIVFLILTIAIVIAYYLFNQNKTEKPKEMETVNYVETITEKPSIQLSAATLSDEPAKRSPEMRKAPKYSFEDAGEGKRDPAAGKDDEDLVVMKSSGGQNV